MPFTELFNFRDLGGYATTDGRTITWRANISAISSKLRNTDICGWDSSFWNLTHWYREA